MGNFLKRWRRDRRGNVAIITAMMTVPLIGIAALAIDVGSAISARATLDAAADSAALLATTVASNQYMAGAANPVASARAAAVRRFNAQAGSIGGVTISPVSVVVTQSGTQFSATVTYTGAYQTALAPVLGVKSIPLGGVSASSMATNPYVDVQVLMDVSASMLLAATPTDITNLQTLTHNYILPSDAPGNISQGDSCAFACHWSATGNDFLALAKLNNVTLRLDVLRSAVGNLITSIASLNKPGTFRLGLSTFARLFTQIYPTDAGTSVSSNIAGAIGALSSIAPDVNSCGNDCAETYFSTAINGLAKTIGTSGNGSSAATSQKFLFIVTDGLVDQGVGSLRNIGPIDPSDCQAIKNQGVTILTLYTPYLPLINPQNPFYMLYVWPYQSMGSPDDIQQAMSACASTPSYAYVASNAAQIDAQLQTMLATVLQTSGHFTR